MSNPFQSPTTQAHDAQADYRASDWQIQTQLDPDAAAQAVQDFFVAEGYRLERGELHDAVYGIGSDMMRIFLGGFVKRNKFKVQVRPSGDGSSVQVNKGMSGMMGGALGYSKMKKELARVRQALEASLRQLQS
ncbi:hypothetical protein N9Y42_10535 [Mariniblastus sp.]|nr:hypothetical protein [Mariniblastus sp.]